MWIFPDVPAVRESAFYGVVVLIISVATCQGQPGCSGKYQNTVACLLPTVVGDGLGELTLKIAPGNVSANPYLVVPLTASLAVPSPASAISYVYDNAAGGYVRTNSSFGPILSERAETTGRNRFYVGFTFQRFSFSSLDGHDLHKVTSTIVLTDGGSVSGSYNFGVALSRFTTFGTYGLTNWLDFSVAVPVSSVHSSLAWSGTLRSSTGVSSPTPYQNSGTRDATGLGDITFRLKGTVKKWEHAGLALGVDIRTPTGDEYDALGTGAVGVKPFIVLSATKARFTPHVNLGYERFGESILAGEIVTGQKRHIPSQFSYAAGADFGVNRRLTLDFDILGFESIHGDQFYPTVERRSFNVTNGAAGFKFNPVGNLLIVFNALFKMNDAGLRSKIVPLVGISYTSH